MPAKLLPPPANVRMLWPQAQARRPETEILQRARQSGRHRNAKQQPRNEILLGSINVEYQVKTGEQGPGDEGKRHTCEHVPRCVRVWLETKLPDAANPKPESNGASKTKAVTCVTRLR